MADPIGALDGSTSSKGLKQLKKFLYGEQNTGKSGAHVAFNLDDFSKNGTVPGWNAGNVPMTGA